MKSQTSLVAQHTRLNEWAQQIHDCQKRPAGVKIDAWCREHGITKATYYWRLRKVREALMEAAGYDTQTEFVEINEYIMFLPKAATLPFDDELNKIFVEY